MDEQNKPTARRKRIVGEGKGIEKKGEGLGTGPVGQNTGNVQKPVVQNTQNVQKPISQSTPNTARPSQSAQRPSQSVQPSSKSSFFGQSQPGQRPAQSSQNNGSQRPAQGGFFGSSQPAYRPAQTSQSTQRPAQTQQSQQHSSRPAVSGGGQRANGTGSAKSGGGSKLILLIAAVAVFLLFGKNLLGGDNSGTDVNLNTSTTQTQTNNAGTGTGIANLLSSFMGSGSTNSAYDFTGLLSSLTGGGQSGNTTTGTGNSYQQYYTTSLENNTPEADTTVVSQAREKYTVIKGGNKDTMTILVYMCGADLESQNGMATSDLKEMLNAKISDKVNLIVFTGGCKKWKNNVVSNRNQIYQIKDGSLTRLVEDGGNASMTSPSTLASFIKYGKENFPANRMCLIFWDHGGGSVSGYGYDERYGSGQTMTLAGINEALKNGGVQFDFVGFDTCLMATVENGLMLGQYADYMIASEETEPGVGWYYTNWLNKVSSNTSMSTVQIGKTIVDDFVEVCDKQCRGQATTLSVVDLAELAATVPTELKDFSVDTNEMIQNKQYKQVSSARSKTREFASSTKIDQIDLVHFAKNMGTEEGKQLADALQGAVKYNRTGGGISNAYGLSIYFPYKKTGKVSQIVSTYKAIGMDDEYTRCIQEFASLEVSGQLSAGTSVQNYGSSSYAPGGLLESLTGSGSSYYGSIGSNYSGSGLESLLGGYFGGGSGSGNSGSTGSILDLLIGRSMTAEKATEYILENHFDPTALVWNNGRITLEAGQWDFVENVMKKLYFDDGEGYIDMGYDPEYTREGNDLVYDFGGTWLSIDRQPVAYYRTALIETEACLIEVGYVPAIVNDIRANLILVFDLENPYGCIAGAEPVYTKGETDTQAKNLIAIGEGDRVQFVCDYYDYDGNYKDSYKLGDPITLGSEVEIGDTYVDMDKCRIIYCLTDYYQQEYWTPAV